MDATPMFPLGTVLLPGMPIPLRIFEPRYRRMIGDVLEGDGTFGVVLIERGNEVGGGDVRTNTGTLARVDAHREIDGQHVLLAVGTDRIRVDSWLPDDPYPQAQVSRWPDEEIASIDGFDELLSSYAAVVSQLRRLLARAIENGHQVAASTFDVPDDPIAGSYLLSMLTPVGSFDRQRLLEAAGAAERLRMLGELISEQRLLVNGD